jgi:hypothetical protein
MVGFSWAQVLTFRFLRDGLKIALHKGLLGNLIYPTIMPTEFISDEKTNLSD